MLTKYRFRPGWVVTLAALVVFPLLVGLGVWQLDRARQKTEIRDHFRARARMNPVDLNRTVPDPGSAEFRQASVTGRYRADLTVYLDNKVVNGVPGYDILTPLQISGSGGDDGSKALDRFILVNRGWVSWGGSRRTLPEIDTPAGVVSLKGRLKAPSKDYFTLEKGADGNEFKSLWENLDLARYRKATGLSVEPVVLELSPDETEGGGFVRQWPKYDDPWIQRHKAYAVQWFSMAFIVAVLYVVLNLEKRELRDE